MCWNKQNNQKTHKSTFTYSLWWWPLSRRYMEDAFCLLTQIYFAIDHSNPKNKPNFNKLSTASGKTLLSLWLKLRTFRALFKFHAPAKTLFLQPVLFREYYDSSIKTVRDHFLQFFVPFAHLISDSGGNPMSQNTKKWTWIIFSFISLISNK